MTPGKDARDGFWFQDARVLIRLLANGVERRSRALLGETLGAPLRIRIEASVDDHDDTSSPKWDSVSYEVVGIVVDETKLGEIKRADRITMYRRLRATTAAQGSIAGIIPRLTTAPSAQPNPEKWRMLAAAVETAVMPSALPESADDAPGLACEALYVLTAQQLPNRQGELVDVSDLLVEDDARVLMRRFRFDDMRGRDAIAAELARLLELLGIDCQ